MNSEKFEPKKNTWLHVDGPGLGEMKEGVAGQKPSTQESIYDSFKTKKVSEPFFKKHETTQEDIMKSFMGRPPNNIIGASIKKKPDTDFGSIVEKQIQSTQKTEAESLQEEKIEEILE